MDQKVIQRPPVRISLSFLAFFFLPRPQIQSFDRFINHKSHRKTVPGNTAECSFVSHKIRLLKPERLACGIFGHLVFSFF
jgi:hypothetical protein